MQFPHISKHRTKKNPCSCGVGGFSFNYIAREFISGNDKCIHSKCMNTKQIPRTESMLEGRCCYFSSFFFLSPIIIKAKPISHIIIEPQT
jgi:hypothetical protein